MDEWLRLEAEAALREHSARNATTARKRRKPGEVAVGRGENL